MMPDKRLLLLSPSRGFGGGIERVAEAIESAWDGPVTRVDLYRHPSVPEPAGRPLTKMDFAARALVAALRSRPHYVLANHVGLLPVAFAAGRRSGARIRVIAHGIEAWAPMSPVQRTLVRRAAPVAVSSFSAARVAERARLPLGSVQILPLAVSDRFAAIARAPLPGRRDDRPFTMLTVSRLAPENRYKGHFDIADAMPDVLRRRPDARWVVVGTGNDLDALRRRCLELGISDSVELSGRLDDEQLVRAYREADLFVLPSVADAEADPPVGEGFGLVYVEAACFGVPSLASVHGGGALDFVVGDVTGVLAPPGHPQALAAQMLRVAEDRELRARLGAAARERAVRYHMPHHFAAMLRMLITR
jgi:phosphatidylinositol alpha-1,6-mannosyltransferase